MNIKSICKLYDYSSVCITGMRGRGKDMLTANVILRRKKPYISNVYYGENKNVTFYPFDYSKLDLKSTYDDLIKGLQKYYVYPYPDKTDVYLSDIGVYFPSQYCNELNKKYMSIPFFCALSRHLGDCSIHFNVQNLQRSWDKLREQSDTYIYCRACKVLFGKIVIQKITLYDKAESCQNRVKPCLITVPFLASKEAKIQARMYRENFFNTHGMVKNRLLIYINKSKYNTRAFREIFKNGVK